MKKLFFASLLCITAFQSKGEIWFDLGLKGAYAPGAFTNSHILGSQEQTLKYSHGYFYGGKIGVNFGLRHGITFDLLFSTTNQTLINTDQSNKYTMSMRSLDVPIMYRNNQDNGGYGEIGPMFSWTQEAEQNINGVSKSTTSNFNGSNMGVAFGFGQFVGGGDLFGLNIGLRFAYMFGDIVASSAQNINDDPVFQPLGPEETAAYAYKPSGRLYAGIALEVNFNLGYITKGSRCTRRTKFRLF